MRRLILSALLFLASAAFCQNYEIAVVPKPGVTVKDLSNERVRYIADQAATVYSLNILRAKAAYDTNKRVSVPSSLDESAELMNKKFAMANTKLDHAVVLALLYAVCEIQRLCNGLCSGTVNNQPVTVENCDSP